MHRPLGIVRVAAIDPLRSVQRRRFVERQMDQRAHYVLLGSPASGVGVVLACLYQFFAVSLFVPLSVYIKGRLFVR